MLVPTLRLQVETRGASGSVHLVLSDETGQRIATHDVVVAQHPASEWEGVFNTRVHVERYADSTSEREEALARVGTFLGTRVLGPEILAALSTGVHRRVLEVHVPRTSEDALAAALARAPWEMARGAARHQPPLAERRFVVHVALAPPRGTAPPAASTAPAAGEAVRVLLVFVDAAGRDPRALRREREALLALFYDHVMPVRRVQVDVLCHGVSRASLRQQVRSAGGYHVIHWSGHGNHNRLELDSQGVLDGQRPAEISGDELAGLLVDAGGFLPHLVFFNACLSGTLVGLADWAALRAALLTPRRRHVRAAPPSDVWALLGQAPDYSGTALALLGCGVPQAVAMRYEVSDTYACDLAVEFYRALFQDDTCKSAADALDHARAELRLEGGTKYEPLDHATPLFFGRRSAAMDVPAGRGPSLSKRDPRPQPLLADSRELDRPRRFVGRARDLAGLRRRWLESGPPAVALIQGLAGLGKTSLAAEAVHLWHTRFDGVFCFQSKPRALTLDGFLHRLDERLSLHSHAYRERTAPDHEPYARVYLPEEPHLRGAARDLQLRGNLLAALHEERLLLVLDNFETQLTPGANGYACHDPRWDVLLAHLADGLPGSGSRVLITSRHRPAVLASPERSLWVALGPLPADEALLVVQEQPALERLFLSDDAGEQALAQGLLDTARGHPLILDRLARLADEPETLSRALHELRTRGLHELPDVFAPIEDDAVRERERAYLEDVAERSIDILVERADAVDRRVAWILALAGEPVARSMLAEVWETLTGTALPEDSLRRLVESGLATLDLTDTYDCHELVRERVLARAVPSADADGLDARAVRRAYGHGAADEFMARLGARQPQAAQHALRAGLRAVRHLAGVGDLMGLMRFGSYFVTATREPTLLSALADDLRAAAEAAGSDKLRWNLTGLLADALRSAGRLEEALPTYESAAHQAETAQDWEDVGWLTGNGAQALRDTGRLAEASAWLRRAWHAKQRAGVSPARLALTATEVLRIDVLRGDAASALPEIEALTVRLRAWWQRHAAGESVPEAPEPVLLGRALAGALDTAAQALAALRRWPDVLEAQEELHTLGLAQGETPHDLARTAFNTYAPLMHLGRLDEAQRVAEQCLDVFQAAEDALCQITALGALAEIWHRRGDTGQALGLALRGLALANRRERPQARSSAHCNVANYLDALGEYERAAWHLLAAVTYDVLTGAGQELALKLHNVAATEAAAASAGRPWTWPRLATLFADAEFAALRELASADARGHETLQAEVDAVLAQARPLGP